MSEVIEKAKQRNHGDWNPAHTLQWNSKLRGGQGDWQSPGAFQKHQAKNGGGSGDGNNGGGAASQGGGNKPADNSGSKGQGQSQQQTQQKTNINDLSPAQLAQHAKTAKTESLIHAINNEENSDAVRQTCLDELVDRGEDASKLKTDGLKIPKGKKTATAQYKQSPEVDIKVPKTFNLRDKNGKVKKATAAEWREKYEKYTDDQVAKLASAKNLNEYLRQIAYEECAARGVDESKIDVSGTLQKYWDREKDIANATNTTDNGDEDEDFMYESYDTGLGDFDVDSFMEQFPEGDNAWFDRPDDPRVVKEFGQPGKQTLSQRQKYDRFINYMKRSNDKYVSPQKQLKRLNKSYLGFLSDANTRPMMVVAGGAGVGKTYGLKKVLRDFMKKVEYDPVINETNDDYDWVVAPQVNSMPKLAKQLNSHNGKIIIFDDNDDLLTNSDMSNLMKTLTDTDPKSRFFPEYDEKGKLTGRNILFTGKLVILTNKTSDELNKNEDAKAVMSRASKNEIKFTVDENLDILGDRYKTMDTGIQIDGHKKGSPEDAQLRQDIYDFIIENKDKLDPGKFTVRKFIEIYEKAAQEINTQKMAESSEDAADTFGKMEDWRDTALEILNKATDANIEKSMEDDLAFKDPEEDWTPEVKKEVSKYAKLIDEEDDDVQPEDDKLEPSEKKKKKEDKKVEKGISDIFGMTLDEAENLLLG